MWSTTKSKMKTFEGYMGAFGFRDEKVLNHFSEEKEVTYKNRAEIETIGFFFCYCGWGERETERDRERGRK